MLPIMGLQFWLNLYRWKKNMMWIYDQTIISGSGDFKLQSRMCYISNRHLNEWCLWWTIQIVDKVQPKMYILSSRVKYCSPPNLSGALQRKKKMPEIPNWWKKRSYLHLWHAVDEMCANTFSPAALAAAKFCCLTFHQCEGEQILTEF